MGDFQELTCEKHAFKFIIVVCALSAPALPSPPTSSSPQSRPPPSTPLLDVQDRIATIDQAALYILLNRLYTSDSQNSPALSPNPLDVYAAPNMFRGKFLRYNALLHPHLGSVLLSRPVQHRQLYYVIAKIPFANNRQMPAIILLPQRPEALGVDRATVTGYFYMVLRQATQKPATNGGPDALDFLVILAARLTPAESTMPYDSLDHLLSMRFSLLGIAALLVVWLLVRRKLAGRSRMGRP